MAGGLPGSPRLAVLSHPAQRQEREGLPRYVCVRGEEVVFLEIKGEGGVASKEQEEWMRWLKQAKKVKAGMAWPSDRDTLERDLA